MTTKEQERNALAKIQKIVAELGPDSYIATAFEGCFEDAAENIENDFACSWKQRAESLAQKLDALQKEHREISERYAGTMQHLGKIEDGYKQTIQDLQRRTLGPAEVNAVLQLIRSNIDSAKNKKAASAEIIVDYADCPEDIAFQDAVKENRSAAAAIKQLEGLESRLVKIITK